MAVKWFNISKAESAGNDGVQTLVICSDIKEIESESFECFAIPIDYKKYEIKTVRAINKTNSSNIVVSLLDSLEGNEVYKSNEQTSIYDIVSVPVEDKDSLSEDKGNVYLKVNNLGVSKIECEYEIKLLNLK